MMKFTETSKDYFEATNSVKRVYIHKSYINKKFMLYMPDRDIYDRFVSAGPFASFESAKWYAEANVGVAFSEESE